MDESKEQVCLRRMQEALAELQRSKPNDRSSLDRHYAVAITELEKSIAYFHYFTAVMADPK